MDTALGRLDPDTLQRLWRTRPVRPGDAGTVAGVCAGFARRYRCDPTLVKVAFVVAALFGGSGVILYILAWITFPATGEADRDGSGRRERHDRSRAMREEHRRTRRHRGHGRQAGSHPPTIVLVVVLVIVLTSLTPNIAWGSGGVIGAAAMLLGWWLLYQRTPDAAAGTSADTIGAVPLVATETFTRWMPRAWAENVTAATTTPLGVDLTKPAPDPASQVTTSIRPPAWDPLGAAPFAWDLPEPSEPPVVPVHRRRSALTPVTLGVAVLAVAVAAAAAFAGVSALTPTRVAAIGLVVVGVGLVIGAVTRRGSGLVPVTVLLAVGVVGASALSGTGSIPGGGVGERDWRPLTENDIAATYEHTIGSATLDLRSVTLTRDRSVRVRSGIGEVKIVAPRGMNLRTRCDTAIGEQSCASGVDGGSDGTAGPVLDIDASAVIGHVEIVRG